jgi:hypothetical protein
MLDPGAALNIPRAVESRLTPFVSAYVTHLCPRPLGNATPTLFVCGCCNCLALVACGRHCSLLMPRGHCYLRPGLQDLLLKPQIVCVRRWQLMPLSQRSTVPLLLLDLLMCAAPRPAAPSSPATSAPCNTPASPVRLLPLPC